MKPKLNWGYALVGDDGTRRVVWGIGETVRAARQDARRWIAEYAKNNAITAPRLQGQRQKGLNKRRREPSNVVKG